MKSLAFLVLLLVGCSREKPGESYPAVQAYSKTDAGIPVFVQGDVDEISFSMVIRWVDLRAVEWVTHKDAWGLGNYSDADLWEAVRKEVVVIHRGHQLPSGRIGWNTYGIQIDVALDWPAEHATIAYDPVREEVRDLGTVIGLSALPHEWKHTLLGDWHP